MSEYVTIHGDQWKWTDVEDTIQWARGQVWRLEIWRCRPALVSKGATTEYTGQSYRADSTSLDEKGWTHDHCQICWWTLHETADSESGEGYTCDGRRWICKECFDSFIQSSV